MTNTQDPIKLLDEYAEARHVHGDYTYNAVTKAARDRAIAALQPPAPQPSGFDAHDMATAAADGFRDGVASVQPPGDAREAFEAFYKDSSVPFWKEPNGEYVYYKSEWTAFQAGAAWQAAQASEPSAEHGEKDRRCECCGYMTYHREHLGCIRAAPARAVEPLTDEQRTAIHDLRQLHKLTTPGEWGKGRTTHDTVSRRAGQGPYRIAEFHHAIDAAFVDMAHKYVPLLLDLLDAHGITTPAAKEQS